MTHKRVKSISPENHNQRGQLRIFLGYAAGVGKTHAMLRAGLQQKQEGTDVACAWVNTHGFEPSDRLLNEIGVIRSQTSPFTEPPQQSLILDEILDRRPALVLIDDLEQVNGADSSHPYRYQDIEELLDSGIHVYTTVNIQHLESLNDIVHQITGITIESTVPDRLFDSAEHIELIDMLPEDLLRRFQTDGIHIPHETQQLYRLGNLRALRELALRQTAQHVDHQMRAYMINKAIPGPWAAGERLLVCISSNPLSTRLVRTGCRMAHELNTAWFVVYVDEPSGKELADPHQKQLYETMKLAEQLGAQVDRITGSSIAEALLDYARQQNITKIIIGQPLRPRWQEILSGSVVNQLIRQSGNIDVHVINSGSQTTTASPVFPYRLQMDPAVYLQAGIIVVFATLAALLVNTIITLDPANLVMFYLLAVVIVALRLGYGPSVITAIASVLIFNFFFVPPRYTMRVGDAQYLLTFLGLFIAGVVIASLTSRTHRQTEAARRREYETAQLLSLTRTLSTTVDRDEIASRIVNHVHQSFHHPVALYLEHGGKLTLQSHTEGFLTSRVDETLLPWTHQHRQSAGRGTETRPDAEAYYVPVMTAQHSLGVLVLLLDQPLPMAKQHLLDASATQAGLALEAVQLGEAAQQAQLLREKERLQSILLNSISHDLRTPLVSITGTLSSLLEQDTKLETKTQHALLVDALSESERLNQLVGNLLDISRLESGSLKLKRELYDLSEIIGVARTQLRERTSERRFIIHLPVDLPMIDVDITLFAQVFTNLFDNALKYSSPHTPIEVKAECGDHQIKIQIGDHGMGIPPDEQPYIFNKFFRASNVEGRGGSGLGLAICQGIVEAHDGDLSVRNREEGGTWFIIQLPLTKEILNL